MDAADIMDRLDQHVRVASYRGKFYIALKSGVVQRWAASNMPVGKDYSMLNSTLWKRAGLSGNPDQSIPTSGGQTYYFVESDDAERAARDFVTQLQRKGVKI